MSFFWSLMTGMTEKKLPSWKGKVTEQRSYRKKSHRKKKSQSSDEFMIASCSEHGRIIPFVLLKRWIVVLGCFASQGCSAVFSGRFSRSYVLLFVALDAFAYSIVFLLLLLGRVSNVKGFCFWCRSICGVKGVWKGILVEKGLEA